MYLTLKLDKNPDKVFTLTGHNDLEKTEEVFSFTTNTFKKFKSKAPIAGTIGMEWAIEVARSNRLKDGETKEFTFDVETGEAPVIKEEPAKKYFVIGIPSPTSEEKPSNAVARIMEYGGHNREEVVIDEIVYAPGSLINIGGYPYEYTPGFTVTRGLGEDKEFNNILVMDLTPEMQVIYDILTGEPEENTHNEGELGVVNGALGAWSKLNYIVANGVTITFPDYKYPVFRYKHCARVKYQHGDFTIPYFDEPAEETLEPITIKHIKEFCEFESIFTSMVLPVDGVNHYFVVTKGKPLKVQLFNLDSPSIADTSNIMKERNLDLSAKDLSEALVKILNIAHGGAEGVPTDFLLKMFKKGGSNES